MENLTSQAAWEQVKQYVLGRLEQELPPNLYYHGIHHTRDDVLPAAERLAAMVNLDGESLLLLRTAVLYHDIGFIEQYFGNEPIAAQIMAETLPAFGFDRHQIQIIAGIILATQLPQTPHNLLEELMCDADLDSLGREDYFKTSLALLAELKEHGLSLTLAQWYERQIQFLTNHAYFTPAAQTLRNAGKQRNIAELKKRLAQIPSP